MGQRIRRIDPDCTYRVIERAWNIRRSKVGSKEGNLVHIGQRQGGLRGSKLCIEFDRAVNITLGLPLIRTSPDHGTAYDIAGTGKANADSMTAAIEYAWRAAQRRQQRALRAA